MQEELFEAQEMIDMISEDPDCSKRLKENLASIKRILESEQDLNVQKAIHAVEELELQGISSNLRSQMWELVSLLESMTA
tara:strand:- start:1548 stop:1787 length:240 start_codon:yes stop_codon:yes gene_type:complete